MRIAVLLLLASVALAILSGCSAKPVDMPVAFAVPESFVTQLRPGTWDSGERKDCEVTTHNAKDLLLCGLDIRVGWSTMNTDEKEELALSVKTFPVIFHGDNSQKTWKCQRTADGIDCH